MGLAVRVILLSLALALALPAAAQAFPSFCGAHNPTTKVRRCFRRSGQSRGRRVGGRLRWRREPCQRDRRAGWRHDCPFKRRRARGSGVLDLRPAIGGRRTFPHGSVLTVRLSAPFALAKSFSYRIRRDRIPRAVVRCAIADGERTRAC